MKANSNILIYSRSFLESGMANVNQTLSMAQNISHFASVVVFMRVQKKTQQNTYLKAIIGQTPNFEFRSSNVPSIVFLMLFILQLCFKKPSKYCIYTRSVFVAIFSQLLSYKAIVELHQDKFSNIVFLDKIFALMLRQSILHRKMKLVVISQALKNIIIQKYEIRSNISVLHDAAEPGTKSYEMLVKRQRPLVVYTGKLHDERSVDKIIKIATFFPDADFRLIGGDKAQVAFYRKMALDMKAINVKVFLRQGFQRVSYFQHKADVLLAFWSKEVPTISYCSPLKLFEYMQTGNKILVHNFKVLKEVLPDNELVEFAEPDDLDNCIQKLRKLIDKSDDSFEMRHMLRAHGLTFSYKSRAESLYNLIEN